MNFCNNCGSEELEFVIPPSDHKQRYCCLNCKVIHYKNPLLVVGCIVHYEGKIVLARRGIEPKKSYWNLPCGFMENDETAEEGALREVEEETGLKVNIQSLHTVYSLPKSNQVYLIFSAIAQNNNYHLTEESTEIKFFEEKDIPWSEIAFSSNTFALEKYFQNDLKTASSVHIGHHKMGL